MLNAYIFKITFMNGLNTERSLKLARSLIATKVVFLFLWILEKSKVDKCLKKFIRQKKVQLLISGFGYVPAQYLCTRVPYVRKRRMSDLLNFPLPFPHMSPVMFFLRSWFVWAENLHAVPKHIQCWGSWVNFLLLVFSALKAVNIYISNRFFAVKKTS